MLVLSGDPRRLHRVDIVDEVHVVDEFRVQIDIEPAKIRDGIRELSPEVVKGVIIIARVTLKSGFSWSILSRMLKSQALLN